MVVGSKHPYIVEDIDPSLIMFMAEIIAKKFKFHKNTRNNIETLLQRLIDKGNIEILFIDDVDWSLQFLNIDARSKPSENLIEMPQNFCELLYRGDWYAMYLLLHELGHIFLIHDRIFHKDINYIPTRNENPEFQADIFAASILIKQMKMNPNILSEFNLQRGVIDVVLDRPVPYQMSLFE